jgi:hypothetical protein
VRKVRELVSNCVRYEVFPSQLKSSLGLQNTRHLDKRTDWLGRMRIEVGAAHTEDTARRPRVLCLAHEVASNRALSPQRQRSQETGAACTSSTVEASDFAIMKRARMRIVCTLHHHFAAVGIGQVT